MRMYLWGKYIPALYEELYIAMVLSCRGAKCKNLFKEVISVYILHANAHF